MTHHEIPNGWVVLKILKEGSTHPIYKVFASWRGSYLDGDSWKINSGIKQVEETSTHYIFHGYSGSIYKCNKEYYGCCTGYSEIIMHSIIEKIKKSNHTVTTLPKDYNFLDLEL